MLGLNSSATKSQTPGLGLSRLETWPPGDCGALQAWELLVWGNFPSLCWAGSNSKGNVTSMSR
jgi:hypothetical protein